MRLLAAILTILALFGASTRCVAECLTPVKVPPCHRHAQGQDKSPADSCRHPQLIAHKQPLTHDAVMIPAEFVGGLAMAEVSVSQRPIAATLEAGYDSPPTVLRL